MRVLVVTAVAAEAEAVSAGLADPAPDDRPASPGPLPAPRPLPAARPLPGGRTVLRHVRAGGAPEAQGLVDVVAGGVGPAAAAVGAACALAAEPVPYDLVVSAGIGGGFPAHVPLGGLVVADALTAADLGAETPDGYLTVDELGFGRTVHLPPPGLPERLTRALGPAAPALIAPVLTVSTVTGTAARAAELAARHPRAAAEAMEGFGVAEAAAAYGVPVAEIRAVSNAVGPRDRAAWRIGEALGALSGAFRALGATVFLEEL
ncbi:futalosine hydrolase [Streptomyces lichenis]|uniref:Futalosine hydrolase n=1 Tax=Streptomyces lichenis TaxID=2306967 RepID=A0ABT0ID29_9ACTN|nr:futalosine hydrolase [Streptomyces lichenis]MCK8679239.1 futalosine hydrolase [Streptomyces lichenis]